MKFQVLKRVICFAIAIVFAVTGCCQSNESWEEKSQIEKKTIRMLGQDFGAYDECGNLVYFSDWINNPDCLIWQKVVSDLEERGICLQIELYPEKQYRSILQTKILEGLEGYDWVYFGDSNDYETRSFLIEQGVVVPINEILENYSDGTAYLFYKNGDGKTLAQMRTYEDGNLYFLGSSSVDRYNGLKVTNPYGINIRYDWLQKLGLELPETTEELYETLRLFQIHDANGNGIKDEVANVDLTSFGNGFAQAFGLGNELVYFDPVTGKMTSPFYQENVKEYFQYMNRLYEAGLLDVTYESSVELQENKLSTITQYFAYSGNESSVKISDGEIPVQWVPIVPLADCADRFLFNLDWRNSPSNYFGITKHADKETIGILLDYISTVEFDTLSFYGIENYSYETINGRPVKYQSPEQRDAQIMTNGFALWVYLLPSFQRVNYEDLLLTLNKYPEKVDACNRYFQNLEDFGVMYSPETMIGEPTLESAKLIQELSIDLKTYQEYLMKQLITGEKSLDHWDSYISDLQELGLDRLINVYQESFNRYIANY